MSSMCLLNFKLKSTGRGKLVGEDLSPILRKNSCESNLKKKYNAKLSNETDSDKTEDLITQLNTVRIHNDDCQIVHTDHSEERIMNDVNINTVREKMDADKLSKKTRRKPQKENVNREKEPDQPKSRNRNVTRKKRDSFIVSDNSTISNDSMTIYHQVLSERIKVDVRKTTPRARLRKSVSTNDDGIFTPYLIGKRSSSESNFSYEEDTIDNHAKLESPRTVLPSPLFPNSKMKDRTLEFSDDRRSATLEKDVDLENDSINLFSNFEPKKRNRASSIVPRPPLISQNFLKDFSWVFTDDSSSSEKNVLTTNDENSKERSEKALFTPNPVIPSKVKLSSKKRSENALVTPNPVIQSKVNLPSKEPPEKVLVAPNPVTPSKGKLSLKEGSEKALVNLVTPLKGKLSMKERSEKALVTPTPITFRLKKIKDLTPKLDDYKKDEPLSFLKSLSTYSSPHALHPDAEQYRKKFKKLKEELTAKLFKMFNGKVFQNKLPSDLKVEWSARLRSSSGLCYNKRIKNVKEMNNECLRVSRIALSTKVIETPDRLRDTLIHEMCHAAAWIIDNKCDGHGPRWRSWAAKAMKEFPELPSIRRCHDYSVNTKFKYRCVKCGYTIGRHSKSLNLERKRCGYCYGQFELVLNNENVAILNHNLKNLSPKNTKAKPLSKFAMFVKENYGKVKSEQPNLKHGEIMKELSRNFSATKILS